MSQVNNSQSSSAAEPANSENAAPIKMEEPGQNDAGQAEKTERWLSGFKLVAVITSITLACFLMLLDLAIVSTAIPRITSEFHSLPDVGWYGGSYQLAAACVQPLTGKIYTYFSSKWTFLVFFAVFEFGSLLCGVATSSTMLIIGRAVAGLGSSGLQNGALTIMASSVPMHRRPVFMAIMLGVSQIGIMMGPIVGGALTEYATWRWCFYINLPVGAVLASLMMFIQIPDQIIKPPFRQTIRSSVHSLDLTGFGLFAGWTIQLLLALQWGGTAHPWGSATIIGLFCGAAANFAVFVVWNYRRGSKALIPVEIVRKQVVWASILSTVFLIGVLLSNAYFLPIYFQAILGARPLMSAVYTMPTVLSQLLAAVVSGLLIGKLGYYLPWALAGSAITCIGNGLSSLYSPTTPTSQWVGYQLLIGGGRGLLLQIPYIATQNNLELVHISVATSLLSFGQSLGGAVFVTVSNTIFSNSLRSLLPTFAPSVDPNMVIAAGATAFRTILPPSVLPGVLLAFSNSIDRVFYMSTALAALTFVVAWGMGWHDIRKKKEPVTGAA